MKERKKERKKVSQKERQKYSINTVVGGELMKMASVSSVSFTWLHLRQILQR